MVHFWSPCRQSLTKIPTMNFYKCVCVIWAITSPQYFSYVRLFSSAPWITKRWLCFVSDCFIDYRWHRHFEKSNENNLNFLLSALGLSTHISFVSGWHYVMFSLQFSLLTAQEHMFLGWDLQHSCRLATLPQQYLAETWKGFLGELPKASSTYWL